MTDKEERQSPPKIASLIVRRVVFDSSGLTSPSPILRYLYISASIVCTRDLAISHVNAIVLQEQSDLTDDTSAHVMCISEHQHMQQSTLTVPVVATTGRHNTFPVIPPTCSRAYYSCMVYGVKCPYLRHSKERESAPQRARQYTQTVSIKCALTRDQYRHEQQQCSGIVPSNNYQQTESTTCATTCKEGSDRY